MITPWASLTTPDFVALSGFGGDDGASVDALARRRGVASAAGNVASSVGATAVPVAAVAAAGPLVGASEGAVGGLIGGLTGTLLGALSVAGALTA